MWHPSINGRMRLWRGLAFGQFFVRLREPFLTKFLAVLPFHFSEIMVARCRVGSFHLQREPLEFEKKLAGFDANRKIKKC